MTGNGSRFKAAGYDVLKPFIEVQGRPMIEWIVQMFPGDQDKITFICRKEHLDKFDYIRKVLTRTAPLANIVEINEWKRKGPVFDVLLAQDFIDEDRPVLVSYCDFYMQWDYHLFKKQVLRRDCDGAIPCYSGFHPHLIPEENLYASCKVDNDFNLVEIREKFSWEKDKTRVRHSPGVYYFKSGAIQKKYYKRLIERDLNIGGEYYSSLPYNLLIEDGLKVWCPDNVSKFCQWGTPYDLEEYLFWMQTLENIKP
tara:strand:- start:27 stop:788 length:762 start_codon:yes stop_codon:yes gene_type:complete